jgi:hypothetical protein
VQKGKVFAVVGHKNWGKSQTLLLLTGGKKVFHFELKGQRLDIKRMSNDDVPVGFFKWIDKLEPDVTPLVVIALCPTFLDKQKRLQLVAALRSLKRRYDLFFFILHRKYARRPKEIEEKEISDLKRFGRVEVFQKVAEAKVRAGALKRFITKNI